MSRHEKSSGSERPLRWEDDLSVNADDTSPFENRRPISQWSVDELKLIRSNGAPHCIRHLPLLEFAAKDTLPIPNSHDREGYSVGYDEWFWLSGLRDYFLVMQAVNQRKLGVGRMLDVGCASGRVLRHFVVQSDVDEVWGCDINHRHIRWLCEFMPANVRAITVPALPSLPAEDNYFDLVLAFSVFTHIDTFETAFLAEIRRVLKPGGLAYLTVHDESTWEALRADADNKNNQQIMSLVSVDPDFRRNVMLPMGKGRTVYRYRETGPYRCQVFHSREYVERVWGRILTIEEVLPLHHEKQTVVLCRK